MLASFTPEKELRIVTEKLLGHLDSSAVLESLVWSSDARRIAYVVKAGTKQCVVVDGKKEKCYEVIGNWIREPAGLQELLRGSVGRDFYWGGPIFSPDSRRLAYVARNAEKWFVVVDSEEQSPYDDINPLSLTFSPDGQRLAYVVGAGLDQSVVVDGKKEKTYDSIGGLRFSPDSRRLAYWAGVPGWRLVVVNGREGKPYQEGGRFYLDGNKRWVRVDRAVVFSPDSRHLAYSAILGPRTKLIEGFGRTLFPNENVFVVVDGKEQDSYVDISDGPIFSPDGQRLIYTGHEPSAPPDYKTYSVVVVDETEQKHYDDVLVGTLHFSPDSQRVAYGARVGKKSFVVVDGKEEGSYDDIGSNPVPLNDRKIRENNTNLRSSGPTFSSDSRRIAYKARVGAKWFVVLDGKQGEPYDDVSDPVFSPDSQCVAYAARIGKEYLVVVDGRTNRTVADGKKEKTYDVIATPIIFDSANALHYIAARITPKGSDVYLVEKTID